MKEFFKMSVGKITGVICGSFYRDLLIRGILVKSNYRTMVWGRSSEEFMPCALIPLRYGCNLIELFEDCERYFDTLIIDCLHDYFDVENVKKFLQWIKKNEKAKQKTILIIFKQKSDIYDDTKCDKLDAFVNLKKDIVMCCDHLYSLTRDGGFAEREYWLTNLHTGAKKKMVHQDGYVQGFFKNVLD